MKYKFLSHTSEIKFQALGSNFGEALESSVLAIASFISKDQKISPKYGKTINIKGTDKENLLYNFIEEILIILDRDNFLVAKANINVLGNTIKAELFGDDAKNYSDLDYIKSPTYSEMSIKETNKDCKIEVVLDV